MIGTSDRFQDQEVHGIFYVMFSVIGSTCTGTRIKSVLVYRNSAEAAKDRLRLEYDGNGSRVIVLSCNPATLSQVSDKSIPLIR